MLIRVLLAVDRKLLGQQVRSALEKTDVVVTEADAGERFWAGLGQETFDLILATRACLPEPLEISLSELHNLPDRPEVIVLSDQDDLGERARLLAAGAMAVIPRSLSTARLAETLQALIDRKRTISVKQLRAETEIEEPRLGSFASASRGNR